MLCLFSTLYLCICVFVYLCISHWYTGMSYLIYLNPVLFKNIAHVGSFKHFRIWWIWKIWKRGMYYETVFINTRAPNEANYNHNYHSHHWKKILFLQGVFPYFYQGGKWVSAVSTSKKLREKYKLKTTLVDLLLWKYIWQSKFLVTKSSEGDKTKTYFLKTTTTTWLAVFFFQLKMCGLCSCCHWCRRRSMTWWPTLLGFSCQSYLYLCVRIILFFALVAKYEAEENFTKSCLYVLPI